MKNNRKTTKEHFKLFQSECEKWVDFFGLYGWSIHYEHNYTNDNYGECYFSVIGRVAKITLNTEFPDEGKAVINSVKETAFHEICELLLARLNVLALGKFASNADIVNEAIHDVIRTLENKIFKEREI